MDSKADLYLCDFGNSLNLKNKPSWNKVNFNGTEEYSAPESKELEYLQRNKKFYGQISNF